MADHKDYENRQEAEGDEDEEEVDETGYKTVKDAVLFAIDVSNSMLESADTSNSDKKDNDSATSAALKCAYALMQQRIISNPNDMMGILLFGTKESKFQDSEGSGKASFQYPHCYLLADLDIPAAADVKRLRDLVQDEEEASKLLIPSHEKVAMSNVLFCANQIFTTKAPNFTSRRLFLITDDDNPHADSKELRQSAVVRAKDLYDLGVTIELFPIARPAQGFDRGKFYDDVVYSYSPSDPEAPAPISAATRTSSAGDGLSLLQSLLTSINSKSVPKRALFSNLPLELGPNFKISVKGYITHKRQDPARQCYVWLEGEKPQIAVGTTTRMTEESARAVEKVEIRKAFKFGGEEVVFNPEELSGLRTFGDPVIRILGFKPRSMLPDWANMRPATFIYPSEEEFVGSTRTFSALQQTLLDKKKMAFAWYVARKNAAPVIVALLPVEETIGEQGVQLSPPGLYLVPLPFADDIRQNPELNNVVKAEDELVDKMRKIVMQLQLPGGTYDPSRYPNPSLQWHYKILQAMALEEDLPEQPDDKTIPRYRQIHKRTGQYVLDWAEELNKEYQQWQRDNTGHYHSVPAKRPGASQSASLAKRPKTMPGDGSNGSDVTDDEMRKHYKQQSLNKLTVAVLKEWLGSKGLSISGKKNELVDRAEGYFETKMEVG